MADEEVPVLIIGGSLVGLSTSLFLAQHGVDHLVVERHPGTAIHPRAAGFLQRTIETYRSAGIQDEVIAASEKEFLQNGAIMSVRSLGGEELEWYFRSINDGVEHLSPSPRLFITQIGLEPVLKERAAELGARLEYGAEVTGLETGSDGATAVIVDRETGKERKVTRAMSSPPTGRIARSANGWASARRVTEASRTASRSTSAPTSAS